MAKPTVYTEEIAQEIFDRLQIPETLTSICRTRRDGTPREKGEFPNHYTVYDWGNPKCAWHKPDFVVPFAQAKLNQQRAWLEQVIDIADTPFEGVEETTEEKDGKTVVTRRVRRDMIAHRTLQINTRLTAIKTMNPEIWGDKLKHEAGESLAALVMASMKPRDDRS